MNSQHEVMKTSRLLAVILATTILSGCAAVVVGGVAASAAHDRRSVGTVIDDQTLEIRAKDRLYSAEEINTQDHIKVEAYNGTLLLVGEVQTEANKQLATKIASEIPQVKRVFNELEVRPQSSLGGRIDDSYLTTKVNTALLTKNKVHGFDPSRVKVVTARDEVYLMGLVSREEGTGAAEVARKVRGVSKVIKIFEYTD